MLGVGWQRQFSRTSYASHQYRILLRVGLLTSLRQLHHCQYFRHWCTKTSPAVCACRLESLVLRRWTFHAQWCSPRNDPHCFANRRFEFSVATKCVCFLFYSPQIAVTHQRSYGKKERAGAPHDFWIWIWEKLRSASHKIYEYNRNSHHYTRIRIGFEFIAKTKLFSFIWSTYALVSFYYVGLNDGV